MEKIVWRGTIKPGFEAEYIRRHDEIWQEMTDTLKSAGICNYTIWRDGSELFGYYECEKGSAYALRVQAESPVVARWNVYMDDILTLKTDEQTGKTLELVKAFDLK